MKEAQSMSKERSLGKNGDLLVGMGPEARVNPRFPIR